MKVLGYFAVVTGKGMQRWDHYSFLFISNNKMNLVRTTTIHQKQPMLFSLRDYEEFFQNSENSV